MVSEHTEKIEGQLVTFKPFTKDLQNFPYATCGYDGDGIFVLYQKIDMDSFPSWNDFKGRKTRVKPGVTGILLSRVGVPINFQLFQKKRPDLDLCVYTVLLNGHRVQVFGIDLA